MNDFFPLISIACTVLLVIFILSRRSKKKSTLTEKRMPRVANQSITTTTSRTPTSSPATSARRPRLACDREYLNYRNCPDCHSENSPNRQVIFKLSSHRYVCTVCGNKFNA